MKYKKKGSALIMVLALTIFIIAILGALFTLVANTINEINVYNRMNLTYYASKAGIERTKKVIMDNGFSAFNGMQPTNYDLGKSELESKLSVLANEYCNQIKTNLSSFSGENGTDMNKLVNSADEDSKKTKSYYNVTFVPGNIQVDINNSASPTLKWKCTIPINLTSEGIIDDNKNSIIDKNGGAVKLPSKQINYSANLVFYLDDIEITKSDKTKWYVLKTSDLKQPEVDFCEKDNNNQ